jgi:hypothetical protein
MDDKIIQKHIKNALRMAKSNYRTPYVKVMREDNIIKVISSDGYRTFFYKTSDDVELPDSCYYLYATTGKKVEPKANDITYFASIDKMTDENLIASKDIKTPKVVFIKKELKKLLLTIKKDKPVDNIINIKLKPSGPNCRKVLFSYYFDSKLTMEREYRNHKLSAKITGAYAKITLNVNYLIDALKSKDDDDDLIELSYAKGRILCHTSLIMPAKR